MENANIERRPLKSRKTKWAIFLSQWLLKRGVKPNQVSLASIIFAALAGLSLALVNSSSVIALKIASYLFAAAFIQARLLCNLLDGMIAIEGGLRTKAGDIFNELPDRLADLIIIVGAGYSISGWPYGIHLGWFAAAMAMLTAYVRVLGRAAGAKQHYCGPMAKPHRMAALTVACVFCAVAVMFRFQDYIMALALILVAVGSIVTVARRLLIIIKELP